MEPLSTVNNAFGWFANVSLSNDKLLRKLIVRMNKKRENIEYVLQAGSNVIQDSGFFVYIWELFAFKQNYSIEVMIL